MCSLLLRPWRFWCAALAGRVLAAGGGAQCPRPELAGQAGATDQRRVALAGIDCVAGGAADPGQADAATESVAIDVLERCYELYYRVATSENSD